MNDIDWGNPKRRRTAPITTAPALRVACVVCGLRADCLICTECASDPPASIAWLERLPTSARVEKALDLLRTL